MMIVPLAVSGKVAIGAVVVPSILAIWALLRAERRDDEREHAEQARQAAARAEQAGGSADGNPPAF